MRSRIDEEMAGLCHTIDGLLSHPAPAAVQFLGPEGGEGASTLSRRLATVAADVLGRMVLLVDMDPPATGRPSLFRVAPNESPEPIRHNELSAGHLTHEEYIKRLVADPALMKDVLATTARSDYVLLTMSATAGSDHAVPSSSHWKNLFESLKRHFQLIIVDSAPAARSMASMAVCAAVDGVVLVLEAERTREVQARELSRKVSQAGGRLLGVILNKRRQYVPRLLAPYL